MAQTVSIKQSGLILLKVTDWQPFWFMLYNTLQMDHMTICSMEAAVGGVIP